MFQLRRWSMLSLFVAVMLMACLVPVGSLAGTTKKGPDMGQALQGLLDQQVEEQGVLGMAMAVQLEDGTLIEKASGYSDPSGETSYSVDTRTLIGSLTKTFTAVVIMQLVEERKLSLDDTIKVWFPDQPNADKITVRMLLSHTSGINNYLDSPEVREKASEEWAPMDLVAEANKLGPVGEPGGSDGFYSNTNFILLGLIIEKATGNSWSEEVKSRIIESLGLRNTVYIDEESALVAVAGGYVKTADGYQNLLGAYHSSIGWSAGAIISTVSDLISYASALFKGDLFESRETLEEMLQPLASQDFGGGLVADFGLGLMRIQTQGMTIWGHPGDVPGYAAFMGYDPDTGATLAATVNTLGGNVIMPAISALQYVNQIQQGEQVSAEPALAQAGNIYEDPEGRFTIPLVGDWTEVKTDGTYALFELTGRPLKMHIVTVESDDFEAGVDAALRQVGIDPAALVVTLLGGWEKWSLFYYSMEDGQGVTVLAQVKDGMSYLIIATGDETLTANPPDNVMQTIGGFTLAGEEVILPTMIEGGETEEVGSTPPITDAEGKVIPGSIASLEEITLGGIQQWILIRGKDTSKPVLLWLHGGPGMAEMPWVGLFQTSKLEANFVVVQWDQRGAGKSFSEDLTAEDMTAEKFVGDTLELTNILRERFNQEKIFLFGHSWGSALGFLTLMEDSSSYYAYIAAAERVDWNRSHTMGYEWVLEQAREDNNTEVIQVLESIQPFDPTNPEHIAGKAQFLELYRGGDLYTEGLWDKALAYAMGGMSPEYTSAEIENFVAGMTFSSQTMLAQAIDYNLFRDFPVSSIPIHFFAGRHDHQTPGELAEEYYNFLEAPMKSFTWFENSGHSMIWDEVDKTTEELIRIANETLNP